MAQTPGLALIYIEQAQAGKEVTANAAFDGLDNFALPLALAVVSGTNVLSVAQSQHRLIYATGALASAATIQIDVSITKETTVINATTGGQTVSVKYGSGGTPVSVPAGHAYMVWPGGSFDLSAAVGGTGASILTGTLASIPSASSNSGNLYLATDAPYFYRSDGSNWIAYGPHRIMTPPKVADYTWGNHGTATADDAHGGIYMIAPAVAGSASRLLFKNAPATPYTFTTCVRTILDIRAAGNPSCGLLWRENASGKLIRFGPLVISSQVRLYIQKYNSSISYNSDYYSEALQRPNVNEIWLRIADDGTNRICSYSIDGFHWLTLHSVIRTDFITADNVGFYAESQQATYDTHAYFLTAE